MTDTRVEKLTFTLKDVIYIVTLIITLSGTYFSLKEDNTRLENNIILVKEETQKNTQTLTKNNLELINYKLDKIMKLLEKQNGYIN